MRGGALRYYRPQGQLGRGFGGLLKRGLKRGLQLIRPHARKALDTARKRAVKYAKEQGIPYLEREAKKDIQHLNVDCLKKWETNQVAECIEEKDEGRERGEIFLLIRV